MYCFLCSTGMVVVFIRFKWIQSIKLQDKKVQILNMIAVFIGIISCVGMTFVANFQVGASIVLVFFPGDLTHQPVVTFTFAVKYPMANSFYLSWTIS